MPLEISKTLTLDSGSGFLASIFLKVPQVILMHCQSWVLLDELDDFCIFFKNLGSYVMGHFFLRFYFQKENPG